MEFDEFTIKPKDEDESSEPEQEKESEKVSGQEPVESSGAQDADAGSGGDFSKSQSQQDDLGVGSGDEIPTIDEYERSKSTRKDGLEKASEEEEGEEQEETESLLDGLKSNKQTLLIGVGGVLSMVVILLIGISVIEGGDSSVEEAEAIEKEAFEDFPQIKAPPGREEQYRVEEVKRMMRQAELKEELEKSTKSTATNQTDSKAFSRLALTNEDIDQMSKEELQALAKKLLAEQGTCKPEPARDKDKRSRRRRPRVAVASQKTAEEPAQPQRRRSAAFYRSGGVIGYDKKRAGAKRGRLLLPAGIRFPVKLSIGVSSAASNTTVLGKVQKSIKVESKVVVPKGSTVSGRLSARKGKIFIDFHTVSVGGDAYPIKGYAIKNNMPGIPAKVVKEGGKSESGGSSKAGRVAKRSATRAGQSAASRLIPGAGLISEIARDVATEGVSELGRSNSNYTSSATRQVLELPAGTVFEVITMGER